MRPSKRMCGDAVAFLPLKRIIIVLVFRCQTCDEQNKRDLLVDYERWGASLGEETVFLHLRGEDGCQITLASIKSTEKMFFFVLPIRQHRGCLLCRKKKKIIEKLVIGVSAASSPAL